MTFIKPTNMKQFTQALKSFHPQLPLRAISSGLPSRTNGSPQAQTGFKSASPVSLTNRESKRQCPTTSVRFYSDEPLGTKEPLSQRISKLLYAAPLIAALPTKAELNERMEKTIFNLVTELKDDLKEKYPDITIEEIKETLSIDCYADNPTGFALHLIDFYESIDRSNAAFPDREPVTVAKAFTDYKEARERILRNLNDCSICLAFFNLTLLPEEVKKCTEATFFLLFCTRLTSLPDFIGELHKIDRVEITGNHFPTFPDCLTKLTKMTRLVYNQNRTETLPDAFCNLTKLEKLNLEMNQISALPEQFGKLSRLKDIDLEHNKLVTLPDSFGSLKELKKCFLKDNLIETLPETFGRLENLTLLQLSDNQLKVLPSSFGFLPSLEELYIERNQLTEFPSILSGLQELTVLILNNNKLTSLPLVLGNLPKLGQLSVANNELTDFPKYIAGSLSLKGLDLGGNQLTEFNHTMPYLKVLLLTKNKITKLPPIEEMPNLTVLSIVKNPIQSLPDNLLGLDQRSHLLNNIIPIGWAGGILQVLKVPNRPTPKITVFEDTEINGHPFFLVIEENHPVFHDEPVSKL